MYKDTVFIDWKTQYGQDINSPQTDLYIQCNLIKIPVGFLCK